MFYGLTTCLNVFIYKTEYQYIAGIVTFGKTESDVKIFVQTLKSKIKSPVECC